MHELICALAKLEQREAARAIANRWMFRFSAIASLLVGSLIAIAAGLG